MSNPNIYELMKVSKKVNHVMEETNSNNEIESANVGLWILAGALVLGLVYYWNYENNGKEFQNNF